MLDKKIFLSIDEYAYFGGGRMMGPNLKVALAYAMLFDEMIRHTDFLTMTAHTMGVSTLDITPTSSVLNSTGLVFGMYGDHFVGPFRLRLRAIRRNRRRRQPALRRRAEENLRQPDLSARHVRGAHPDHKYLNLAVVNATDSEQKFDLSVAART